jgi:hypothetical protein
MGAVGHFLLSTGSGVTGKTFTREVSVISVLSGTVTVVSAKQAVDDPERAGDYSVWANEVLAEGVHIVNFKECELSDATMALVYYGV